MAHADNVWKIPRRFNPQFSLQPNAKNNNVRHVPLTTFTSHTSLGKIIVMISNHDQAGRASNITTLILVFLLGATALVQVITPSRFMVTMIRQANVLRRTTDPVQRDLLDGLRGCASYRTLDRSLDPQARIFLIGMLGETNAPKLGIYFYMRNYVFPHDIEMSLGTNLVYSTKGFEGTPCDSLAVLKSNGFDDVINFENNQFTPLTPRGQLR